MGAYAKRQLAGEQVLLRNLRVQTDGLRKTGGWMFVSLGFWALMIGYTLITGQERGRP